VGCEGLGFGRITRWHDSSFACLTRTWLHGSQVSDFGLARIKADETMSACGTVIFAAPEVLTQNKYSEKADVFSFGMVGAFSCATILTKMSGQVLYEILTQHPPWGDMPPMKVALEVTQRNLRPPIPENCPTEYQALMQECWSQV